jgi:hypothetical protein
MNPAISELYVVTPAERGCQEILRTEKFVAPRKRPKGKRPKSLASRFRGNDEKVA